MTAKRRISFVLLLVVFVAVLLRLWSPRPSPVVAAPPPIAKSALTTQPPVNDEAKAKKSEAVASSPPAQKPSPQLKRTFQTLNHNSIEFFGRAIDQFGEPVGGAEVSGVVLYNTGTKAGEKENKTTTDTQGYFRFADLEGQDLGIGITKEGYEYRNRNSSFSYSYFEADHKRHIPDPKSPVIFTLWKKQGAETLVHYDKSWRIPANGTPVRIDLVTGKMGNQEADLIVAIERTPLHMRQGERGFEWKVSVEVSGGGFVRAGQRDYYNLAPADGYEPRFEFFQAAQNVRDAQEGRINWTWVWDIEDTFFVSSRGGKNYARIKLRVQPNADRETGEDQAAVDVVVWLNPNGSRNLEFDRSKVIKPAR